MDRYQLALACNYNKCYIIQILLMLNNIIKHLRLMSRYHAVTSCLCFTIMVSIIFRKEDKLDMVVLKHVLLQHQHRVIKALDEEDIQRISVRRSHLFQDALRAFSKPTFNVGKMLKVCFIGEPAAIDDGGPRREFFSLLTREIFRTSGLFSGWPNTLFLFMMSMLLLTTDFMLLVRCFQPA